MELKSDIVQSIYVRNDGEYSQSYCNRSVSLLIPFRTGFVQSIYVWNDGEYSQSYCNRSVSLLIPFRTGYILLMSFLGSSPGTALHQKHHTRLCTNLRTHTHDKGKYFEMKLASHKSLCYFRTWRRSVRWTGIILSNSWLRNVCNYAELRSVRTCTASWDSASAEGWNHAGAEQTQRTADIRWHAGNDLPGHGCVRWGNWNKLNCVLRVIDRSNISWILLLLLYG